MIAIDLGSNTIRFIEFDGNTWGKSFEKIVKTVEERSKFISTSQEKLQGVKEKLNALKDGLHNHR